MPVIQSNYIPHPQQVKAHCSTAMYLGYGGAMGGGKTRWLCEMIKQLSIDYPGNYGFVCRASGPALRETVLDVMFTEVLIPGSEEWDALGAHFNKTDGKLYFENIKDNEGVPSKIWFSGLDSANLERLKSLNLGFFAIEEATEVPESVFMMLGTRLRRKQVAKYGKKGFKGIITANPEAGWIKRRFIDQDLSDHEFIFANFEDNPHLPDHYASLFDTFPQRWRDKYLYGKWDAASGLVYKEFIPEYHIIPPTQNHKWWKYSRGLDHGQQNPCACIGGAIGLCDYEELVGIIGTDRIDLMDPKYASYPVIIIDHLYYSNGRVSQHKQGIQRTYAEFNDRFIPTYADPSIWNNDREMEVKTASRKFTKDASIADEYKKSPYALKGIKRAKNNVLPGIDRISTLLSIGHLFFIDNTEMQPLIGAAGEIRNYSWKQPPNDSDDWPEVPEKKNDHACDALRYLCMSLPRPIPFLGKDENTFMNKRQEAIAFRKAMYGRKDSLGWKGM